MDDRQPLDAEPLRDLVGDRVEDRQRHRLVRLVLERLDAPPGVAGGLGLLARGRACPASSGSGPGSRRPPPSSGSRGARPARRGSRASKRRRRAARGSAAPPAVAAAARTGGIIATSSPSARTVVGVGVVAVAGEADATAARAPGPGGASTSARQAASTSAPSGEVEGDLARPGQLALDREQADPDADRTSAARSAAPASR